MTLKDILEDYGIDFSTLQFKLRTDIELDNLTKEEVLTRLATDELIADGSYVIDFQVYGDKPNGWVELYLEEDLANRAEAMSALIGG